MKYFIHKSRLYCSILFLILLNSCNENRNNTFDSSETNKMYQKLDSFIITKINIKAYRGCSKLANWKPDSVIFIKELNTEIYLFYRFNFTFDDWGNSYKFSVINNKNTNELFFQPFLFESIELKDRIDSIEEFIPSGINSYLSSINFNQINNLAFFNLLMSSLFLNVRVDLRKSHFAMINNKCLRINNYKKLKNVYYLNGRLFMVKLLGFNDYKARGLYINYFKHEPKLSILIKDVTIDFIK